MRASLLTGAFCLFFCCLSARADEILSFSIQGSDLYGHGRTVLGTTTIDTTIGTVQTISFTAGGVFESGINYSIDRDYFVGTDNVQFSFTDPLVGYQGGKFNLNGPNDFYVGDVFDGVLVPLAATPEPGSVGLVVTGLVGVAGIRRRRGRPNCETDAEVA